VLDTLTGKDFQEPFQKWRWWWEQCLLAGGNYFEGGCGRSVRKILDSTKYIAKIGYSGNMYIWFQNHVTYSYCCNLLAVKTINYRGMKAAGFL
jgi:hypothetical protein